MPEPSSIRKRLLSEGAWVAFGQIAIALAGLAGVRIITHFVSRDVYGKVSLVLGMLAFGARIFCAPWIQATYRFYSEFKKTGGIWPLRRIIGRYLRWTVAGLEVAAVIAAVVAWVLYRMPWTVFLCVAFLIVIETFRNMEYNLLGAAARQRPLAIARAAEAWSRPLLAVGCVVLLGATTVSVLAGYAAAEAAVLVGLLLCVRREGTAAPEGAPEVSPRLVQEIHRYALPIMPLAVVGWMSTLSDRYIIGGLRSADEVGVYAASYGLMSMPLLLMGGIVAQTLRPSYFSAVSTGNRVLERKAFRVWLWSTVGICLVGVLGVCFLKDWIARLLLDEDFRGGAPLMPWLALGNGVLAVSQVYADRLLAYKKSRSVLLGHSVTAALAVGTAVVLVYFWGLMGAAIACPCYFLAGLLVLIERSRSLPAQDQSPPSSAGAT